MFTMEMDEEEKFVKHITKCGLYDPKEAEEVRSLFALENEMEKTQDIEEKQKMNDELERRMKQFFKYL